jgi:acetyltransferase EpsM
MDEKEDSSAKELFVIGGGGHASVVSEIASLRGYRIAGFFDDNRAVRWSGMDNPAHLGCIADVDSYVTGPHAHWFCAVGDNRHRKQIVESLHTACKWATLIHPSAVVSSQAQIAEGTMVGANGVIQINARVLAHAIVNTAASVDHDCQIGSYAHVAPGVRLCGGVVVSEGCLIGVGSSVLPNVWIGGWATVGAGSVVLRRHIGPLCTVFGIVKELK